MIKQQNQTIGKQEKTSEINIVEKETGCKTCEEHTIDLIGSYLSGNTVELSSLPEVFKTVYGLTRALLSNPEMFGWNTNQRPAVPIEESVTDDYIVCLEDGKKLQMLKRHLSNVYGMSLGQYKEKWRLPRDYPTVSPNYARRRSGIAKSTGLGRVGRVGRPSKK